MKCSDIKLILSDYIDNTLDAKTRSLVERHLRECEACQKDYASLKSIISELGRLPKINAPDDFLKNLHERMESRFDLKKIMRTLFVPFKIKVPLELLTATATAVIIIFFINVLQQERPVTDLLYNQKTESLDDASRSKDEFKSTEARSRTQEKSKLNETQPEQESLKIAESSITKENAHTAYAPAPSPAAEEMTTAYKSGKEEEKFDKPIQLALILDSAASPKPYASAANIDKKDQRLSEMESQPASKKQASVGKSEASKPLADSIEPLTSRTNEETLLPEEGLSLESDAEVPSLQSEQRIRSIIKNNAGKVISVNYDDQTRLPVSILAEIPSSRLKAFYSQLSQIGQLKHPLPVIDEKTNERLRVNILLISSP